MKDTARPTPVERVVCKVARMILAAHHTILTSRQKPPQLLPI
ncbi:hypothetical protein ACJ70A_32725 [Streptomyces sp. KL110A]